MNERPDLADVQDRVVGFLGKLKWQPSNLRVQAGDITVEVTWPAAPAAPALDSHENNHENRHEASHENRHEASHEAADAEPREYLTSPAVGVFYHAKEPGADPFVAVGSAVERGQQVGIVEAMKLMIPVEADRAGLVVDVLKANGDPVEYDEPLFALAAAED